MRSEQVLDERYTHIISGVFGAVASALLLPSPNWRKLAATIITGSAFSAFVIPGLCAWVGIKDPQMISTAGFFGGVLGCTIVGKVLKYVEEKDLVTLIIDRFRKH